jgi:hypothetical protein
MVSIKPYNEELEAAEAAKAALSTSSTMATIREAKDTATRYTLCRVLAIFTLSAWWGGAAVAQTFFVAPSPRGNDFNDCSSPAMACATFQRAVDLCPVAHDCAILAAPGIYSQTTNVTHFKHVFIFGPTDQRGACIDRRAVNVEDHEDGQQSGAIFWAQDHATLRITCMRLAARGRGHCAFLTRQFAIGDVDDVDFGAFADGCGVGAGETSKINIGNPGIYGNARLFASASDLSQVTVSGLVKIADGLKFDVAFLASVTSSVVSFYPSGMEGGAHFSGASYQCSDASLKKTVVLPGGDVPYLATDECKITGVGSSKDSTLAGKIRSELDALAGKIDDVQHAENVQRRFDRVNAATVVLVLVLAAGAAYYRLATLKK